MKITVKFMDKELYIKCNKMIILLLYKELCLSFYIPDNFINYDICNNKHYCFDIDSYILIKNIKERIIKFWII